MILALYVLTLMLLAVHASDVLGHPGAPALLVLLLALGLWPAATEAVHLIRALLYRRRRFPPLRAAADGLGETGRASEVQIVITAFPGRPETSIRVVQAVLAEAVRYGAPTSLVALVAEEAERRLIKRVFSAAAPPPAVRLLFVRRPPGAASRGLAAALTALSRTIPADDAVVLLIDGTVLLPPGVLGRSLPFLRLPSEPDLLVPDRDPIVAGGRLRRAASALVAARRHQLTSSLALARTMTPASGPLPSSPMIIARARDLAGPNAAGRAGPSRSEPGGSVLYLPDVRVATVDEGRDRRTPRVQPGMLGALPSPGPSCRASRPTRVCSTGGVGPSGG